MKKEYRGSGDGDLGGTTTLDDRVVTSSGSAPSVVVDLRPLLRFPRMGSLSARGDDGDDTTADVGDGGPVGGADGGAGELARDCDVDPIAGEEAGESEAEESS